MCYERVYISTADRQAFHARNRDNQAFPCARRPLLIKQLDYPTRWDEREALGRICQRCLQSVCIGAPGLGWRPYPHAQPLYWHYDCYRYLQQRQFDTRLQAMRDAFTPLQAARLDAIASKLQRVPLGEFTEWRAANGEDARQQGAFPARLRDTPSACLRCNNKANSH